MPFDVVWFCLFGACVRVPVCLYVGMCICMPCTWDRFFFYFLFFLNSEELSLTEEQQKVTFRKQTVWQQRSLLILQLGIFKCNHTQRKWKERERRRKKQKQRKGKIEVVSLYLSCPKLSHSAAWWGFLSAGSLSVTATPFLFLGFYTLDLRVWACNDGTVKLRGTWQIQ